MRTLSKNGWSIVLVAVVFGVALASSASGQTKPDAPKPEQVIVVFKTHFDIGYTDLARNVVDRYRTSMIDKALDVCDHTRTLPPENRFVWTVSGWPMTQILWPGQTPQRRTRIEQAIRDGLLVWHALPCTTHTESLDLEDLVRGLGFSSRLSRQFSMPLARDGKMTDVPSHTWILPTILKHAGIEFMHIGCNSASASPELPALFWWEGPDGSRVLTMYEASGYGSGLTPPAGWPSKNWLAMIHTGDNAGPPPPSSVQKLLEQARKQLPGIKIRMGRLSDFADAVLRENPQLPVVRLDMTDTWIHGPMSMPAETKLARNVRPDIIALESLHSLLQAWGVKAAPVKDNVAAAYEGSLMYGEHTWGYSMPLNKPRPYGEAWQKERAAGLYERIEESWREHGDNIRRAESAVAPALAQHMAALAQSVRVDGPRIVVFNPLPWTRDDVVGVDVAPGTPAGLRDLATGKTVPADLDGQTLRFVAHGLPAMGYRTYVPASSDAAASGLAAKPSEATIENAAWRVELDSSRGVIRSLIDKRSGRQWVDAKAKYGLGQYVYERFDADINDAYLKAYCKYIPSWYGHFARFAMPPAQKVPYKAASPEDFRLDVRLRAASAQATLTAAASKDVPHAVSLEVTLYHDLPYVDLTWSIKDKQPDTWPEAGWLALPLAVERPEFLLGRLGSIVNPAKEVAKNSNFEVFCLNTAMTVTGPDGAGMAVCPLDSPLVSLGRPGIYRHTREFTPREPVVLVNLFNNVWGTNFQQWIGGSWTSRVRLWATSSALPRAGEGPGVRGADGGTRATLESDLITPAWQARSRAKAAFFRGPAGTLPPERSGLELSRRGVQITAFGQNPDGDGTLLRLWEQAGRDGVCRVRLPDGSQAATAQPCDLRGRAQGKPIPVRGGQFEIRVARFAPASVILVKKP